MKKFFISMMALAAIATANAEEVVTTVENNNETTAEIAAPVESPAPEAETPAKNTWGAKLKASPFSIGLSMQTKYIWRGMEMIPAAYESTYKYDADGNPVEDGYTVSGASAPVLFPTIGFSWKGLYVYAMGGYAVNGKYAEVDFGASYTWKWLTVGINDYYYPTINSLEDDYFNYKNRSTGHWLEACITIAPEKIPASLTVSNFFAGADKNLEGKQAYSTYAELSTWYDFLNDHRISATCGMAFNKSCYNGYAKNFGVCNVELKYTYNLTFKNGFALPLSGSYILNPVYKKSYFNFTASFTL